MRISDWSSDVCSSDLFGAVVQTENPVNFNVPVTIVDGDCDTAPGALAITTAPPFLVIGSGTDDDAGEPPAPVDPNPQRPPAAALARSDLADPLARPPGPVAGHAGTARQRSAARGGTSRDI